MAPLTAANLNLVVIHFAAFKDFCRKESFDMSKVRRDDIVCGAIAADPIRRGSLPHGRYWRSDGDWH